MKAIVLLNEHAGTTAAKGPDEIAESVKEALGAAGIEFDLRSLGSDRLVAAAKEACGENPDAIIACGGDGTISTVAAALADCTTGLGVLPLGTLNHFAKDLKIPLDLRAAAEVIAEGNAAPVDLGYINDRVFINNSSLGIYAYMVIEREGQVRGSRLSKGLGTLLALGKVFRRFPLLTVRLEVDGQTIARRTPLVFIGNNAYQLELLNISGRNRIDEGQLSVYVANTQSRWGMVKLMLRTLVGRLKQARDFETFVVDRCTIDSSRRRLHVAHDGEVDDFAPPLEYRSAPGALRVFVPAAATERAASEVAGAKRG